MLLSSVISEHMHTSNVVHESATTIMFADAMFWMSLHPERSTSSYAISASRSALLHVLSSSSSFNINGPDVNIQKSESR